MKDTTRIVHAKLEELILNQRPIDAMAVDEVDVAYGDIYTLNDYVGFRRHMAQRDLLYAAKRKRLPNGMPEWIPATIEKTTAGTFDWGELDRVHYPHASDAQLLLFADALEAAGRRSLSEAKLVRKYVRARHPSAIVAAAKAVTTRRARVPVLAPA